MLDKKQLMEIYESIEGAPEYVIHEIISEIQENYLLGKTPDVEKIIQETMDFFAA